MKTHVDRQVKERPILFNSEMVKAILDGRKTQTRRLVKPPPDGVHDGAPYWFIGGYRAWKFMNGKDVLRKGAWNLMACPFGVPGDRLWVRENFTYWERPDQDLNPKRKEESRFPEDGRKFQKWMTRVVNAPEPGEDFLVYKADGTKRSLTEWVYPHPVYDHCVGNFGKTIPSIHMPRWASRITLEVTGVRVERVQDISEEDALAEGVRCARWFQTAEMSDEEAVNLGATGAAVEVWNKSWDEPCYRNGFATLWEEMNGKWAWSKNPWVWVIEFKRI